MQIIYDYQIFSIQKYGGISRYMYEVATRVAQAEGFDVKILAFAYINQYLKKASSNLVVGLPIPVFPKTASLKFKLNNELSKVWLKRSPPNIVHQTYYLLEDLAPKESHVVLTVYDMIHEKFGESFLKGDKTTQAKTKAIQRADHIICISQNTKKDLLEIFDINPCKISVVYLGYSLNHSLKPHVEPVKMSVPYILYVGDRKGYKNFQRVLEAYCSSSKLKADFSLVCFGTEAFSAKELDLMQSLRIDKNKVLHIFGNDDVLTTVYKQASAFVYPSLYEGFGIPPLEAMALDCPVVCSNTSSMPEVVGNAAESFNPYEPENIAEALENVLYSSDRAKNLIELGQQRIKQFSWQACAEQTRLVYLSLV